MKTKIKNRALIPLALLALALGAGCATGNRAAHVEIPRLVPQACSCPAINPNPAADIDLDIDFGPEPLPFVKHPLEELEADEAAGLHSNPEREAREAIADFQIGEFLRGWERP